MSFNKGYELKKFEAHWEKLRIEYAAAGMTKEAIQKMYDYDRQQFNSERTFIERTQEFTAPAYESSEEEASPLMLRYIVNEPKVSFRNGRYYVMDGQHTIEGCILLNGGEDRPILCKVYTGLTMEQEALLFAEQNGHSAPLSAGIKLRAKVVGGDAPSKAFVAATNRVGLSLNYDSMQLSDYRISCVGTALKLYDQLGEEIYCEALRHIVAAWEGRPDSFRAAVLRGVMYFMQLYHGQYSAERLVRALGGVHPMELYRISRDNPAKLPGWRRYVYPIYTTYNGKCRKDALPMKF